MKKLMTIVLSLVLVLGMSVSAFASPAPKTVEGTLEVVTTGPIYEGQDVVLRARIMKHGSKLELAEDIEVVQIYEDGYYIVEYTVKAKETGTQNERYDITMTAGNGKSAVVFNGFATTSFEVLPVVAEPTIEGITAINVVIKEINYHPNKEGVINNIDVTYDVYYVLSDGDTTLAAEDQQTTFGNTTPGTAKTVSYDGHETVIYLPEY